MKRSKTLARIFAWGALFAFSALCFIPMPAVAQALPYGAANLSAAIPSLTVPLNGQNYCFTTVYGTWSGVLTFAVSGDQQNQTPFTEALTYAFGVPATTFTTVTANGLNQTFTGGMSAFKVTFSTITSGSPSVVISCASVIAASSGGSGGGGGVVTQPTASLLNVTPAFPYLASNGQTAAGGFLGAGGIYNVSPPTLTNSQFNPFQLTASGALIANVNGSSVTVTNSPAPAMQEGTGGALYPVPALDTATTTASITTATTTLILAGAANTRINVFACGWVANGTNSADTVNCEQGTTTSTPCDTNCTAPFTPIAPSSGTASGQWTTVFAGNSLSGQLGSMVPAANPFILNTGYSLYCVTVGTTIAGQCVAQTSRF